MRKGFFSFLSLVLVAVPPVVFADSPASDTPVLSVTVCPSNGCGGGTGGGGATSGGSSGGGGGGGGGALPSIITGASVVFTGRAYAGSKVTVLKDGAIIASATVVGNEGLFNISVNDLQAGSYLFGVYAEDVNHVRSPTVTAGVTVSANVITTVSGIFIPPTIDIDKTTVKQGSPITIFGSAVPQASVSIAVNSQQELNFDTLADKTGFYSYSFNTAALAVGTHSTHSSASISGAVSGMSKTLAFTVGTEDIVKVPALPETSADLNDDHRVNLIDFSIEAFWYKKSSPPKAFDLNGDGKVNLVDFSILASQWTG